MGYQIDPKDIPLIERTKASPESPKDPKSTFTQPVNQEISQGPL